MARLALDDDDLRFGDLGHVTNPPAPAAACCGWGCRCLLSSFRRPVLTGILEFLEASAARVPGMARRPISAASSGATPFMNAIIATRSTCQYSRSSSASLRHVGGQRSNEAVAHQDAQEGPHQSGCDLLADFFRRSAQRAHG